MKGINCYCPSGIWLVRQSVCFCMGDFLFAVRCSAVYRARGNGLERHVLKKELKGGALQLQGIVHFSIVIVLISSSVEHKRRYLEKCPSCCFP